MLRAVLLTALVLLSTGCAAMGVPTPTPAPSLVLSRPAQPSVKVAASAPPAAVPAQPSLAPPTARAAATAAVLSAAPPPALLAPSTPTPTTAGPPLSIASPTPALTAVQTPPLATVQTPTAQIAAAVATPSVVPPPAAAPASPAEVAEPGALTPTAALPSPSPTSAPATATPTPTQPPPTATPTISPTVTPSSTVTTTPVPNQVGQRFISGPVALTVHSAAKAPGASGQVRVIAEVSIENLGSTAMGIGPAYFKLAVGSGGPNSPYTGGAEGTTMPAATRQPGGSVRANVAFQVPIDARGLTLSYEPLPPPPGYSQIIRVGLGE